MRLSKSPVATARQPAWFEGFTESAYGRMGLIALLFSLASLTGLGSVELWGIREKRAAACVADVLHGGHWLVPQLRDLPRLEKPPLPYWTIAAFSTLTGRMDEWTLRLPGAAAALLIVFVVYLLAAEAGGPRAGLLASLFLTTSLYFMIEARQASSDLYLAAFTTCALACWWYGRSNPARRMIWWSAAGLFAGLAMLCKGPVALAIIGPPIIGFQVWQREFRLPRSAAAWSGIVIATVVAAIWPVAVFRSKSDAWITWVLELDRKAVGEDAWGRTWFYYLVQWPQYLFPWSGFALASVGLARRRTAEPSPAVRVAWLWFFGDLVLFSLATSRKQYYLLPAVPGLAILAGQVAAQIDNRLRNGQTLRWDRLLFHIQWMLLILLAIGLAAASIFYSPIPLKAGLVGGALVAVVIALLWRTIPSQRGVTGWIMAAFLVAACAGTAYAFLLPQIAHDHGAREFARRIETTLPACEPLYYLGEVDPAFWFYLRDGLRPLADALNGTETSATCYFLAPAKRRRRSPRLPASAEIVIRQDFYNDSQRVLFYRCTIPSTTANRRWLTVEQSSAVIRQ